MNKTPPDRAEIFNRHYARFQAMNITLGDEVVFKRPKRNKQVWTIVDIAFHLNDVKWTQGGTRPNFIELSAVVKDRDGTSKEISCWTCENQIIVRNRYAASDSRNLQ